MTSLMIGNEQERSGRRRTGFFGRWWSGCVCVVECCRVLIVDWMQRDRIRISPTEGRLCGLREEDRILLFDEIYVVRERCVCETSQRVVYHLVTDDLASILVVPFGNDGVAQEGVLEISETTCVVFNDDVVVLK